MRQLELSGLLIALSLTAGCVALPAADVGNPGIAQQELISSWQNCVKDNVARLKTEGRSPQSSVDNTLVACQGHREDVLATFPHHLHKPLHKFMDQQTWETGYAAWSPDVRELAQSAAHVLR